MKLDPHSLALGSARLRTTIRGFFEQACYLEVQTPILVTCPGAEANLDYFSTEWVDAKQRRNNLFLRSSPEIQMKTLLSELSDQKGIYELAPSFRNNGELGRWHRPEFTMLEWYGLNLGLAGLTQQTEALIMSCLKAFDRYDIVKASHLSARTLLRETCQVDFLSPHFLKNAQKCSQSVRSDDRPEDAFFKLWIEKIDPIVEKIPLAFVSDWPEFIPTLAKSNNGIAARLETYVYGLELSNGYEEVVGEEDNKKMFSRINQSRSLSGKTQSLNPSERFFNSTGRLAGQTISGNAMGFDRLLAICLNHSELAYGLDTWIDE